LFGELKVSSRNYVCHFKKLFLRFCLEHPRRNLWIYWSSFKSP